MATSTGRDGGLLSGITETLAGVQGGDFKTKGLQAEEPEIIAQEAHTHSQPASKEMQAKYGDVDTVAPGGKIEAAKQQQDRDRGSSFTSSSGKPSFVS